MRVMYICQFVTNTGRVIVQIYRRLKCHDIVVVLRAPVVRRATLAISGKVIEVTQWSVSSTISNEAVKVSVDLPYQ